MLSAKQTDIDLSTLYEHGCRDFGENKVQAVEMIFKDIRWHMIGICIIRLNILLISLLIHSVDSLRLREIIKL